MVRHHLIVFGCGYTGAAVARAAAAAGFAVTVTSRRRGWDGAPEGVGVVDFAAAGAVLPQATHVLATVPPEGGGDPVLAVHGAALRAAPALHWAGYLSTTGVYGDRGGGWVDEATPVAPGSERSRRRVAAEQGWAALAGRVAVDLFRVAGIYGPGRSALDDLRAGRVRMVVKPGHAFGRIHRDDIAAAVLAAMRQDRPAGVRVLHLADDVPAETVAVVTEAARLLGMAPPPAVPFAQAQAGMSEMARSFWMENRKVSSARTQQMLDLRWRYPSYREGLRAILAEQRGDRPA
ncbi:Rossmann-fold NAD(P)-binding domain-containing protein [Limobrevibacterium gyesilva]|uniref:SDR family NAD(P)-dependent oxidoreductase n=1 Tax=Limobrevibacterium gyesilva TaxID=2991712 RepID=A0AA42CHD2_9PROT|nr:SDR family NAD(P)-dependent oxidoreductase [Limobrevibacterium gyesilva]MCW3474857.1 SDR family NAD(P)-dependent oxidoreductase [Limobrevibacterium gyesilva]